jgi:hypothetical protein
MRRARLLLLLSSLPVFAADAVADWKRVTARDVGPGKKPESAEDALKISLDHLDAQEKALREFIKAYPDDSHIFSAKLRLARLLGIRAELKDQMEPDEADRLFEEAGELAKTPQDRTDLDFMRLTRVMRRAQGKRPTPDARAEILAAVRRFQQKYPKDHRIALLLVETSTLFEGAVDTKETLLREASRLTANPELKAQIADDLKRVKALGHALPLQFTGVDGKNYNIRNWRGKPVVLLFWATSSGPSLESLAQLREELAPLGDSVVLATVSLDQSRENLVKYLDAQKITLPVAWDGKGWNSPIVQALGINAIPSGWLIDQRGVVRSLDVLEDPAGMLKKLR